MTRVYYDQPGYAGSSMSERAVLAYENGEKPKSKWTKKAMLQAIAEYCDNFDLKLNQKIEKLKKEEIFDTFFYNSSWHHTSKFANETDFFALDEDTLLSCCRELTAEERAAKEKTKAEERAAEEHKKYLIHFLQKKLQDEWQNYTAAYGCEPDSVAALLNEHPDLCNVRVSKKGNTVVDYEDDGQTYTCMFDEIKSRKCWNWCALPFSRFAMRCNNLNLLQDYAQRLEACNV